MSTNTTNTVADDPTTTFVIRSGTPEADIAIPVPKGMTLKEAILRWAIAEINKTTH